MEDFIKALEIFSKYEHQKSFSWCSHDEFHINVDDENVSSYDIEKLSDLGFDIDESEGGFYSFRYGSC